MSKRESVFTPGCTILRDLCRHICTGLPEEHQKSIYRSAIVMVANSDGDGSDTNISTSDIDEFSLCQRVERQIRALSRDEDVNKFYDLFRRLKLANALLKNPIGVVSFLVAVSEGRITPTNGDSTSDAQRNRIPPTRSKLTSSSSLTFKANSGEREIEKAVAAGDPGGGTMTSTAFPSKPPQVFVRPTTLSTHVSSKRGNSYSDSSSDGRGHPSPLGLNAAINYRSPSSPAADSLSLMSASPRFSKYSKMYASESTILNELMYCFQGVPGNIFKMDTQHGFIIDPQVRVPHRAMVERLLELGYLHNKLLHSCQGLARGSGGSVAQAVEAALRKQLTNYYGLVGCMQSELVQSCNMDTNDDTPLRDDVGIVDPLTSGCAINGGGMTLRRLVVWVSNPMRLLQCLCDAAAAVDNLRGGAVISSLDILRYHGDPSYSANINFLLGYACKPLMNMISNWMVEGELFDPFDEFFISVNTSCQDRDIWKDKFVLRQSLIPNIITQELADMILMSGKAVHFLNVICDQRVPITGARQALREMKVIDLLQLTDPRSKLSQMVVSIFKETSQLVLTTLVDNFKLFQHFQGLRRYILLGQGDFANYFMELVEPEMRKPASQLQYHELNGLLGTAIRSSTAAYEDPEIMRRVSIKLLVASGGDWGSDVFGLQYLMHDPLDAAFGLSDGAYSHMFNFLWRTKRMEYILLSLRKERWANKNKLNWLAVQIPEVNNALVLADRLSQELVHFARQFHYYILFEVVECQWEKFWEALQKAASLDDVISAHGTFIKEIQAQTFQDEESRKFINELRLIWNLVFELETLERRFLNHVEKECTEREERERRVEAVGTCCREEAQLAETNREFRMFLANIRAQYSIIISNYEDVLKKFLMELSVRKDHRLRLLSARIDYNEHYKRNDSRIFDSMKFSRCSDLFE